MNPARSTNTYNKFLYFVTLKNRKNNNFLYETPIVLLVCTYYMQMCVCISVFVCIFVALYYWQPHHNICVFIKKQNKKVGHTENP